MATLIGNNKPSMMAFPSALNRMGTFPIDISSVWYSYDEAVAYATQTNFTPKYEGQTGLPYVGQILTVVETAEDGTTSVTAYSIQNEAGDLAQVGTVTLTDEASITKDKATDQISIYNFKKEGQGEDKFPIVLKDEDGKFRIHWTSFDKKSISKNKNGEIEIDGFKAANNITYPRKSADGTLEWVTISEVVEGATSDTVTTGDNKSIVTKEISGDNEDVRYEASIKNYDTADTSATNDYVPFKDATNGIAWKQVYTKSEVYNKEEVENKIDKKLTSVFKFKGVKTYKSELPTTGQAIGDVWLVIYDGDAPVEGEANTLPVSNSEYVWISGNKWENLGDDIVDLSNYYTKAEVNTELAKKGAVDKVEDGIKDWTVKVTDAKGNVTHAKAKVANASNEAFGLVKGDGANVSIADGVITVNEAGHAAEATHATNADNATNAANAAEATHATNADDALRAEVADKAKKVQHTITVLGEVFDGSADVEIATNEVKAVVGITNYYTKDEANNNFMDKSEFDTEVKKIVQPINEELDKIKGEGYGAFVDPEDETKGKIEPSLMSLYEHNKGQDGRLDTAESTIEQNTDRIKAIEDDYVDSKKLEDSLKPITDDLANKGKVDDVVAAETAWDITVQYADDTTDKTVTIKTTTASKEQAGLVSVGNNIDVEAGKISVATAQTDKLGLVKGGQSNNSNVSITDGVIVVEKAKEAAKVTSGLTVREADKNDRTYDGSAADTIDLTPYAKTSDVNSSIGKINTALADRYTKAETNTYVAGQIAAIDHLKREVVESLPGTPDKNTIYLLPKINGETDNIYLEYMYINNQWEIIGDTKVDLTDYATKDYVGEEIGKIEHKWGNITGKPNLSYVEAKETTFSSTTTLTAEEGKIRNIEVYDADGERVILDIKRTSDLSYTLTAVGSTETLTVTYEVIHTVA